MGPRCKFYHGSWAELRAYKNTEYIEGNNNNVVNAANTNKSKKKKYVGFI